MNIDESIHIEWLEWIKEYVQQILATNLFAKVVLIKVLVDEDMSGITYSVQYYVNSKLDLEVFQNKYYADFQSIALKRFGDKMLIFSTELELIEEFKFIKWDEISKIMRKPSWLIDTRNITNYQVAK